MTLAEIEAMAEADTPTAREIVKFFVNRQNEPADYFQIMPLGSQGAIAGTLNRMLEDGLLERVPDPVRAITRVRLKYDPQ